MAAFRTPVARNAWLLVLAIYPRWAQAWVDHYDEGEDDAKVVRVFLPLIACAILTCIGGCYFKKHCAGESEEDAEKDTEGAGS